MIPSEGAIPLNLLRWRDGASGITSTRSSANACVVNLDKPLLTTLNVITSTRGGTDILTLANSPLLSCVIVNFFSFFSTLDFFEGGVM